MIHYYYIARATDREAELWLVLGYDALVPTCHGSC